MSEPIRYTLKYPIVTRLRGPDGEREETVRELTLRRVKARDIRAVDAQTGEVAKTLALLSQVTDQPAHIIDELDMEDIVGLGELVGDFLPASLGTGQTFSGI